MKSSGTERIIWLLLRENNCIGVVVHILWLKDLTLIAAAMAVFG